MKPTRVPVLVRLSSLLLLGLAASSLLAGDEATRILLDAHFDDKPVDQPIGTGGPDVGEPISISPHIDAIVRQDPDDPGNRLLELSASDLTGTVSMRFEFVDQIEVSQGRLMVSARVTVPEPGLGQANLYLREAGGAARSFLSMTFHNNGTINISDAGGLVMSLPNFIPFGQPMLIEVIHDLDERTYDLLIDGVTLVEGHAHGVEDRGIGSVIFGLRNALEIRDARMLVDDVLVAQPLPDTIFAHDFEYDGPMQADRS